MKKNGIKIILALITVIMIMSLAACAVKVVGDLPNGGTNETPDENGGGDVSGGTEDNDDDDKPTEFPTLKGVTFADKSVAYDGNAHEITVSGAPDGAEVDYSGNSATAVGEYKATAVVKADGYKNLTLHAKLTITPPTAETVVAARQRAVSGDKTEYDFKLNMSGTVDLYGVSQTANGNYDGKYRYDKSEGNLKFERTTSGLLLYDSTEYVYNSGSTKIKVVLNEDGKVKKTAVVPQDEEELNLINLPFTALVDALDEENLENISEVKSGKYKFKANIRLSADNQALDKILSTIGKMGTSLEMGDVIFTNPVSGLTLYFNLGSDMKLNDFELGAEIQFPVKGVPVKMALTYSQEGNDAGVEIPSIDGLIVDKQEINRELAAISGALATLKMDGAYSLDLTAKNEFDPGWNVTATTDSYRSRMYKNTYDLDGVKFVAFNNSYEYKTHHEEDGAETYKYTIGNIQDGSVHRISRKGANEAKVLSNVTVNARFDYLTTPFKVTGSGVDCLKKESKNGSTLYYVYLNTANTLSVKNKVADFINSNDADGVVKVDNFFNDDNYLVQDAIMVVEMQAGKIVGMEMSTKIKYNPTEGDFIENKITLTDTLTLKVNDKLSDAKEYEAPKDVDTKLLSLGLNNFKFYIL